MGAQGAELTKPAAFGPGSGQEALGSGAQAIAAAPSEHGGSLVEKFERAESGAADDAGEEQSRRRFAPPPVRCIPDSLTRAVLYF
jgi:hypothetical protein